MEEALRWLRSYTGERTDDVDRLLRSATRRAHPDAGGDPDAWHTDDRVRQLLRTHHRSWTARGPRADRARDGRDRGEQHE